MAAKTLRASPMKRRCEEVDGTTPESSPGSAAGGEGGQEGRRLARTSSAGRRSLGRAALLAVGGGAALLAVALWGPPRASLLRAAGDDDPTRMGPRRREAPNGASRPDLARATSDEERVGRCSCFRPDDESGESGPGPAGPCCQRAVLKNHKFGMVLTERLFRPLGGKVERHRRIETAAFPINPAMDYRHAVLVRNYFEALVSGYLYHKSGHECWLTLHGDPRTTELNVDWDVYLNATIATEPQFDVRPYPPRAGRSICRYLADEPDEVGMRVYIAVALRWWYSGLDDYHREVTERRAKGEVERTLFLCLGDFPDPVRQVRMFYRIMDWLYPGGHNHTLPPRAITAPPAHEGHASTGNSTVRRQLLDLVGRLDRDVFHSALSATDARFGCKSTIRQIRRT